ncbi:MAG: circularly permuted type 2 ATP-grasp protein, partial [Verrucomicrobiota bacterium]
MSKSNATPYHPLPDQWDEAVSKDGSLNPAWREWMHWCSNNSPKVFQTWDRATKRFVHEFGAVYSDEKDADNAAERWSLDPVPWIISEKEWNSIEEGIKQRVELAAAILDDLYGPGRLLKEGVIPAEIVLRHGGFLRAFCDREAKTPMSPSLGMAAFDLARGPKGQMWLLNQRADSQVGLGFALENRSIVGRVMPSTFQACKVRRLAGFFRSWRQELEGRSWPGREPRIVILTDGTEGSNFESFLLANYLGYTLVRPGDLSVRNRQVWLRSLGGLERIHVIWRTMSGRALDPLECGSSHSAGIPGLFEAVRAGNVMIYNHPGIGVLESPGWFPFLPAISKLLLDQELTLPTVATWWCGQPPQLDYVLQNLSQMVIKSVNVRSSFKTYYGSSLSQTELDRLRNRILADPSMYVGQEQVHFSTVPSLVDGKLEPRTAVLRTFAMRTRRGHIRVLSGGLARAAKDGQPIVSTHEGGVSKDVWIRSENDLAQHKSIWSEDQTQDSNNPVHLPSRTGENLFWTGRYAERADATARYLGRLLSSRIDGFDQPQDIEKRHEKFLLSTLLELFKIAPLTAKENLDVDGELRSLLEDHHRQGSIPAELERLRFASHEIRDIWSGISLRAIEACVDGWDEARRDANSVFDYYAPLERLLLDLTAFLGLNLESMTRDAGWCLLDAGRRIERAVLLTGILDDGIAKSIPGELESLVYESVLTISDSLGTFRRQ